MKVLQPTVRSGGIVKKIGWHTFRRMRHSKISTTMEVYAQAGMDKKRAAQRRAVDVLLDRKPKNAIDEQTKLESSWIVPANRLEFPEVAA